MRTIALFAVAAVLALQFAGAVPQSSVGGPMTLAFLYLLAMLAVGMHEAWSTKRGVLGWIVSIILSLVGGFIAAGLGASAMDLILPHLHLQGSLASTRGPLLYVASTGMMLLTLLGSWLALSLANRFR